MSWQIVTGDCLKLLPGVPSSSVRLVFADPPYNISVDYGDGKESDSKTYGHFKLWCRKWVCEIPRILTPDGSVWVMMDVEYAGMIQELLRATGLHYRETICWVERFGQYSEHRFGKDFRPIFRFTKSAKEQVFHPERVPSARQLKYNDKRANPNGRIPSCVWDDIPRVCGTFKERIPEFPTQLPLRLLERIVRTSADPGDLILDPFTGSGTTGVATLAYGCNFLGFELRESFASKARDRLISSGNSVRREWLLGPIDGRANTPLPHDFKPRPGGSCQTAMVAIPSGKVESAG